MHQKELFDNLSYIIKNDIENPQISAIAKEIVFLEGQYQKCLIATNKNDTCHPFKFKRSSQRWFFSKRDLNTIDDDSINGVGEYYDYITLEKAKAIIGDVLPDEKLLDEIHEFIEKKWNNTLAKVWIPKKRIKERRWPTGSVSEITKDGLRYIMPAGEIIETTYECHCGKGTVQTTFEAITCYMDGYVVIQCKECYKKYRAEYDWMRDSVILKKKS